MFSLMMVAILVPEVESANGVNTFSVFTSEITILTGEVLKKTGMCTGTATAARKKSERRNAWECRFLEIDEVYNLHKNALSQKKFLDQRSLFGRVIAISIFKMSIFPGCQPPRCSET